LWHDARFELRLTDGPEDCSEILLLDLRLFRRGSHDERMFIGNVAKLAQRFATADTWSGFTQSELSRAIAWSTGKHEEIDDTTLVTLLPRVLAQTDFSLPIILFSSTGRRDIVAELDESTNILTHFSKPFLLRQSSPDIAERAEDSFAAAIECARRLVLARSLCQRIVHAAKKNQPVERRAGASLRHFEIYIDESGSSAMSKDPDAAVI
jgi:hypothetical protein